MNGYNKAKRPHEDWVDVIENWWRACIQELSHSAQGTAKWKQIIGEASMLQWVLSPKVYDFDDKGEQMQIFTTRESGMATSSVTSVCVCESACLGRAGLLNAFT